MKTIILSAGKATRLLPLTKDAPQSLLLVGSKTILERQIDGLERAGVMIGDVVVVTGHLSKKLDSFCREKGIKTLFNPFYDVSGNAASLWIVKDELDGGFIFGYSDVLFDAKIIQEILKSPADICLAIKKNGLRAEAEKVVENAGVIKKISKAKLDKENGEFIGIARFSSAGAKKVIQAIEANLKENLNISFIDVIDGLVQKGENVAACDIGDNRFIDIDFPADLEKAAELFN